MVATVGGSLIAQYAAYCACFNMSGVGSVYATTNNNVNDPTLHTDVVTNGAVVAALLGFDSASPQPTVAWTGLTERFDGVRIADEVFSGASIDISGAAVPAFAHWPARPMSAASGRR